MTDTATLTDIGIDIDELDEPNRQKTVKYETIQETEELLMARCEGVDFSVLARKRRREFVARVDTQIENLKRKIVRWEKKKRDCLSVMKFDEAFEKLEDEKRLQNELNSCMKKRRIRDDESTTSTVVMRMRDFDVS